MRACIEPCHTATHDFHIQSSCFEIATIEVRNFELSARRRRELGSESNDFAVIEIESSHCESRPRDLWLLFQTYGLVLSVKLHDSISLRIDYSIGEHGRAVGQLSTTLQLQRERLTVENVVAENQRARAVADEIFSDKKRLRQAIRTCLHRIGQIDPPLMPVAQQVGKPTCILRSRNNQDVRSEEHTS